MPSIETKPHQVDTHPFSLACCQCDAGDGINTWEQAVLSGWREIQYNNGLSWNFLGHCPDCIKAEEEELKAIASKGRKHARK